MKIFFLLVLLVAAYIFVPTYDLYVKQKPFDEQLTLIDRGYYSQRRCQELGRRIDASSYRCLKHNRWTAVFAARTKYVSASALAE